MAVSDAVKTGNKRQALEALRDKICETIDNTDSGRDIAALSKRLMEVLTEIEALPNENAELSPLEKARKKVGK